jgi:23S rRNA (adenine2503-C2)-methyltransferase
MRHEDIFQTEGEESMKIVSWAGRDDIAMVYVVQYENGKLAECVESLQPPLPRDQKWVLLVSTMFGCPVRCKMCDAGGYFQGKLGKEEILSQIDYLVTKRYPDRVIPSGNFKIQFARMGEPALNPGVLDVLEELPGRYQARGLLPSLSTIAPQGTEDFFERLLTIKQENYSGGKFQFQFSLHTSDEKLRDEIIPVRKWDFSRMARYGERFYQPGDRKITLNFALAKGNPLDPDALLQYFDPSKFLIKITPLNPTHNATRNGLSSFIDPMEFEGDETRNIVRGLEKAGYQVLVSIGEVEENAIGSNCGQYVLRHLQSQESIADAYSYSLQDFSVEAAD